MKRRNGSYREVMVVGLAGLVLTLMPTGGLRSAVAEESVQAARRQDQADIELRPLMRGQIDRDERTKSGLDVRKEEREPVETARTCLRRRTRCRGRRLLQCRQRRKTDVGATVEPTAVKLKC